MDNLTDTIGWLFVAANAGRLLGYLPQIITAWNCRNGASSVSRMTWAYFAFAHSTGILYAMIVIRDASMALVFLGNFIVCCLLIAIVTWKKRRHGHAGWPAVDRRKSGACSRLQLEPCRNDSASLPRRC